MEVPEYISKQEVQRVCAELGIRDWTQLKKPEIAIEEAEIIQKKVGGEALMISAEAFQGGLEVELEHGLQFSDANVTNNHPILTGMIVLAHLKEMLDYYERLKVAELEGDLLKAMKAGNFEKASLKYKQLVNSKADLSKIIRDELKRT